VSASIAGLRERIQRLGRARVVLVGDTGIPGPPQRAVGAAIRAEKKDFVVALGDLIYPVAPKCPGGSLAGVSGAVVEERFRAILGDLGAPVFVVLGNHDVAHIARSPEREACYFAIARRHPGTFVFPSLSYEVDFGLFVLALLNTNDLTTNDLARVRRAFDGHAGWRIAAGHHVFRTYHDKEWENRVRPVFAKHGVRPDLYVNGHAHLLQLGLYDGVPAVTSGSGANVRRHPECPPHCGEGQIWGKSVYGYAVLDVTRERIAVTFKDQSGAVLRTWTTQRPSRR
jgi:predicted phosphodiesterase